MPFLVFHRSNQWYDGKHWLSIWCHNRTSVVLSIHWRTLNWDQSVIPDMEWSDDHCVENELQKQLFAEDLRFDSSPDDRQWLSSASTTSSFGSRCTTWVTQSTDEPRLGFNGNTCDQMTTQSFVRQSSKTRLRPVLWEKGSSAGLNHDSSHRFTDYGRHLVFPEFTHFVTDDPTLTCPLPDRLCASRGHDSSHRINDTIAELKVLMHLVSSHT